ncbi:MAG: hypothetical protein KIT84_17830 [Labilithrix sp.]|nr:hypothetical protein [Labilithrix sp.]MCW5812894.1 hypothetical protein [Labilithrix sp.]
MAAFDGDVLLAYCSTQLNDLNGEIKARMNTQQRVRDAKAALNKLQQMLNGSKGIDPNDHAQKRQILEAYADVLKHLPPGTAKDGVIASLQQFRSTACYNDGPAPKWVEDKPGVSGTSERNGIAADISVANVGGRNRVNADELKAQVKPLGDISEELGKTAELEMIILQQLVSQRQQAISMTTNMMNKCSQGTEAIAGNIGR